MFVPRLWGWIEAAVREAIGGPGRTWAKEEHRRTLPSCCWRLSGRSRVSSFRWSGTLDSTDPCTRRVRRCVRDRRRLQGVGGVGLNGVGAHRGPALPDAPPQLQGVSWHGVGVRGVLALHGHRSWLVRMACVELCEPAGRSLPDGGTGRVNGQRHWPGARQRGGLHRTRAVYGRAVAGRERHGPCADGGWARAWALPPERTGAPSATPLLNWPIGALIAVIGNRVESVSELKRGVHRRFARRAGTIAGNRFDGVEIP